MRRPRSTEAAASATLALSAAHCEAVHDPLLDLIREYRDQLRVFDASGDLTDEENKALMQRTWGPHYDRLITSPPNATTLEGALAAVRLVAHEERTCGSQPSLTITVLGAALAYFERVPS